MMTESAKEPQQIEDNVTLVIGENGQPKFELPEGYESITGSVSVMTPYATDIVHDKQMGSIAPFSRTFSMVARHYAWPESMKYTEERHPELTPNKMRIKPWGETEKIYEIDVVDRRGGATND